MCAFSYPFQSWRVSCFYEGTRDPKCSGGQDEWDQVRPSRNREGLVVRRENPRANRKKRSNATTGRYSERNEGGHKTRTDEWRQKEEPMQAPLGGFRHPVSFLTLLLSHPRAKLRARKSWAGRRLRGAVLFRSIRIPRGVYPPLSPLALSSFASVHRRKIYPSLEIRSIDADVRVHLAASLVLSSRHKFLNFTRASRLMWRNFAVGRTTENVSCMLVEQRILITRFHLPPTKSSFIRTRV